jgi:uncharacterized protein (UPF0333 family)
MDNKGFISVEYIFSLFVVLIIACSVLFYSESTINSSFNIEDSIHHRLVLDNVANAVSQVNSNGVGFSKYMELPSDIGYFEITVEKSKLTIEYDGKKGETTVPLLNIDKKYRLVSGKQYCISKDDDGRIVIA